MTIKLIIINALTMIRVLGTIILIPIYKNLGGFWVGILALVCYLTDSIDGILARKWNASTFFGALFDGVADKLFTIINFIVLYLITPYAIIPIIFELAIVLIQILKFACKYNVQSNIIGKAKVWVLAFCVVTTFLATDFGIFSVNNVPYFWLLLPAMIMEIMTFISYVLEVFFPSKFKVSNKKEKKLKMPSLKNKSIWENFKAIWLNPEFYKEHKDDTNLTDLRKLKN